MCGIVGIIAKNAKDKRQELNKMIDSLYHRGPDENGSYFFDSCLLGHTRLSIIDLSSGQQPMKSPVSDIAITFNGEIYGYLDIREYIKDYPFKTNSDTEVVLALHEKYGLDMMPYLPGMFSFAIWDNTRQRLFCARDRFGEKPFYYAFGKNGEFIFASEIKAILVSGLVDPILSIDSLEHYFKYFYIHPYQTIYKNIHILPSAHKLVYENNNLKIDRYWNLPETSNNISFNEAQEEFERLFEKSVQKQLVADVPVGVFLSGGLDSSSIVAAATKYKKDLKTFSFGFLNSEKNELTFAREVAKLYGTEHIELTDSRTDLADLLIEMQNVYDEPFADNSNIPTYLISKLAREHTKVAIGGDGGDELLAGYRFHRSTYNLIENTHPGYLSDKMFEVKRNFYKMIGKSLKKIDEKKNLYDILRKYNNYSDVHNYLRAYFKDDELVKMGLKYPGPKNNLFRFNSNTIDDILRIDLSSYLTADILVKVDRAAMANSLELRAPFLDVDFASFCISLPYQFKINKLYDKLILRECYEKKWPELLRNRHKQGFGIPVDKWLKKPDFIQLKNEYLNDKSKKIFSLIEYNKVRNDVNINTSRTWILLVLSIWLELHEFSLE